MRTLIRSSVAFCLVLAISIFAPLTALAQQTPTSLTEEQRNKIKSNCVVIKNAVQQLKVSDALLRVNRGQVYESMGTNLMDSLNTRLGSNRLDNAAMLTVTAQYRTNLETFRADYTAYAEQLSAVMKIDCTQRPEEFHAAIEQARTLRSTVHADVQKLHRSIDDYRLSVGDFMVNFQRVSK